METIIRKKRWGAIYFKLRTLKFGHIPRGVGVKQNREWS